MTKPTAIVRIITLLTVLFAAFQSPVLAQQKSDINAYIFGNSLVNHPSNSPETAVPQWLHHLAKEAGNKFAVDGQFGFLRNFATDLPPTAGWSFPNAKRVWKPEREAFADTSFNTILITPANFIQYQPSTAPYDWKNPENVTPLDATLSVLDWVSSRKRRQVYYIYQGWADMGGFGKEFPPTNQDLARYHAYSTAEYDAWYVAYLKQLQTARPGLDIRIIPVATTLAGLLTQTPLADIPVTDLYTDSAPHGTPTLYFLASLITYKALFGESAPKDFEIPATVHQIVRDNYEGVLRFIDNGTFQTATASTQAPQNSPSLAMGLDGIADWSAQQPFVNVMKSAREWTGHVRGQWGGWGVDELKAGGYLDANGWITKMPAELSHIESFILTNQPPEATSTAGRYRLTYTGEGKINVGGLARNVTYKTGEIWFDFIPSEDPVGISISQTDPQGTGNYIRDIAVVKESNIALFEVGVLFNPLWIRRINGLRSVRFMDWMFTNGSKISRWDQRPKTDNYTYVGGGAPVEVMVALANQIGADPWFNMPHLADNNYSRNFATYVRDNLDPDLITYVEYSNEVWNFTFPQTAWALQQAKERWGRAAKNEGWMQFAGMKAAQVAQVWREVFGEDGKARLVRVIATHTDWPGLEQALLQAPLWQAEGGKAPVEEFDAYAVSGYFGHDLGSDLAPKVLDWIAAGTRKAEAEGSQQGLKFRNLRAYVAAHRFDDVSALAAEAVINGSLKHLLNEAFPYQATVAKNNHLRMVMYEGGTHTVGIGEMAANETLSAFFNHFSYTPEMAEIYDVLLKGWAKSGGTLFNAFVDVARTSNWGSWGALRHLDDSNPRWDILMKFNQETPAWWSDRPAKNFAHGIFLQGSKTLTGTIHEDTLLGSKGDDILISNGGADYLHGGAGNDQAILLGQHSDYTTRTEGDVTLMIGPSGTTRLFSIEQISFADQPTTIYAITDF